MQWTQGPEVLRLLFLVGDAPPHMDYKQDTKCSDVVKMALDARHHGQCRYRPATPAIPSGSPARSPSSGKGDYIPIPQDGGRGAHHRDALRH